jgi:hypothetical protein
MAQSMLPRHKLFQCIVPIFGQLLSAPNFQSRQRNQMQSKLSIRNLHFSEVKNNTKLFLNSEESKVKLESKSNEELTSDHILKTETFIFDFVRGSEAVDRNTVEPLKIYIHGSSECDSVDISEIPKIENDKITFDPFKNFIYVDFTNSVLENGNETNPKLDAPSNDCDDIVPDDKVEKYDFVDDQPLQELYSDSNDNDLIIEVYDENFENHIEGPDMIYNSGNSSEEIEIYTFEPEHIVQEPGKKQNESSNSLIEITMDDFEENPIERKIDELGNNPIKSVTDEDLQNQYENIQIEIKKSADDKSENFNSEAANMMDSGIAQYPIHNEIEHKKHVPHNKSSVKKVSHLKSIRKNRHSNYSHKVKVTKKKQINNHRIIKFPRRIKIPFDESSDVFNRHGCDCTFQPYY